MATTEIVIGNPTEEALNLYKQLQPIYLQNFKASMEAVSPGASGKVASMVGSLLSGAIPQDVAQQLAMRTAELNLAQGRYGSAAQNRVARDFGLTSLDLQQKGASLLKTFMPEMPDINVLLERARAFDLGKAQMQLQESQFARQLAEQARQANMGDALSKLKLSLSQSDALIRAQVDMARLKEEGRQFDVKQDWDKTVSVWNKQFEQWSLQEQSRLMQDEMASKERIAAQTSKAKLDSMESMREEMDTWRKSIEEKISAGSLVSAFGASTDKLAGGTASAFGTVGTSEEKISKALEEQTPSDESKWILPPENPGYDFMFQTDANTRFQ